MSPSRTVHETRSCRPMPPVLCCSGVENILEEHVLQTQPAYCVRACSQMGWNGLIVLHQHSGDGARHSNGKPHLAQCFCTSLPVS